MSDSTLTTIRFDAPERVGNAVRYRWNCDPTSGFYRRERFELQFPDSVDVAAVSDALLLRVMLICLHPHWAMLRPCRVILPFRLPEGEREFWLRFCDAAVASIEIDRRSDRPYSDRIARGVELIDMGPPIGDLPPVSDRGVVALSFSGGRDSLTQLGLLQELGERPLLVTTTAPRTPGDDHETARRRHVLATAPKRREAELIEVRSDFRACWDETDPRATRFGVSPNELTDTLLYFSSALVTAAARGARTVFLAAEADVQENVRHQGSVVQHPHFMYSAVTQSALATLLEPSGIGYCGLTSPLLQFQIQRLFGLRYPDLGDLQYSCWQQRPGEDVCSRCRDCFSTAINLLSGGVEPATIGMNLDELFPSQRDWRPGGTPDRKRGTVAKLSGRYGDENTLRVLRRLSLDDVNALAGASGLSDTAAAAYEQLRASALAAGDVPPEPGFRAGYLEFVDPRVRDGLAAIYGEHYAVEPEENHREMLERSRLLAGWIAAPLTSARSGAATAPASVRTPGAHVRPRPPAPVDPRPERLAEIADLIPGPEPELAAANGHRLLPVADVDHGANELAYVTQAVESGWFSSTGPFVARFEEAFAKFCGVRHAVACASGTTALEIMLRASGIGAGDEVIMPAFTMVATANAVHHVGAEPVFVDSDPRTWNIDLRRTVEAIGPRTRAVLPMHTYGHPVDIDAFRELADANSLLILEDAAEAHGARLRGRLAGSLGDAAAFSFYGNKILTTGEGGMVTTDSDEIAKAARDLSSHAFSEDRHFWHRRRAFNYRMSNLQAALGLAQLERVDDFLQRRRRLAALYREHLGAIPGITLPPLQDGFESANWMFGMLVNDDFGCDRDELRERLAAEGVETRTFFIPLHIQPAYLDDFEGVRLPVAETLGRTGLYLPSALWLTEDDVARIAAVVRQMADSGAGAALGANPSSA